METTMAKRALKFSPLDFLISNDEDYRALEPAFPGFVYVIHSEADDAVKVGVALRPSQRILQLQTGTPNELALGAVIATPRYFEMETYFRRVADNCHIRGEWFDLSVLEAVEGLLQIALRRQIPILPITAEPWPMLDHKDLVEPIQPSGYRNEEERRAALRRKLGMD